MQPQQQPQQDDFEKLLDDFMGTPVEGSIVKGIVISVENDLVIIDVGLKAEGRISLSEFAMPGKEPEIKVGDEIEVYVERMEGQTGQTILSRERARREEAWAGLEDNCKNGDQVEGMIIARVRGGFTVQLDSVQAFLPGSQIDMRPIRDITPIMNCLQPFQILSMDKERGNIVVSRRAIMEESRASLRSDLIGKLEEGQVLQGTIKNITNYGAFVDLGGLDGLLHVTDISWKRINHPSEVLHVGDEITVKVIRFDVEKQRISLGIKQLEEDPWGKAFEKYQVNTRHMGKITNITEYGAFIELEEGIEGLVHVSEMSWTKKNFHPGKMFSTSQEIEVMVLDVDNEKRRVSLGIKQCVENPWKEFEKSHPVGSIHKGIIKNIAEFGIFVGLDNGIDGMVHSSDLSWTASGEEEIKKYQKEQEVEVKILDLDPEKERIALGIKQLTDNPKVETLGRLKIGEIVTATVIRISDKGVDVDVEGVMGFISKSNLSKERAEQRSDRFAEGEKLDAKIIKIDDSKNSLILSIKAHETQEEKTALETYGSSVSGASLGDILGAALKKQKTDGENETKDTEPSTTDE